MSDLVQRLRAAEYPSDWTGPRTEHEAADAIARLTYERDEWRDADRAECAENAALKAQLAYAASTGDECAIEVESLRSRLLDAKEQVAALESREVCTVAHDDCVLGVGEPNFCPYCEIERLINESEEMRKVRLMLYAERDYARQAARNADAKLAEAERLLDEASPRQECDGCGREFRWHQMFVEEGDRWECAECWDRCEKAERAAMRDRHDDK